MKNLSMYAFLLLALCSQPFLIKADFVAGSKWTKTMSNGQQQHIIFIGDRHDTGDKQQVEDLLDTIPQDALAIVEDITVLHPLYFVNYYTPIALLQHFFDQSNLIELTWKLQKRGIQTFNTECRTHTYIHASKAVPNKWNYCEDDQLIKRYLNYIQDIRKETLQYTDSQEFNQAYSKFRLDMHQYQLNLQEFQHKMMLACVNDEGSILANVDAMTAILGSVNAENDIRTLHQIYRNPNKKFIFVIVGDWHKRNIESIMESLGYHKSTDRFIKDSNSLSSQDGKSLFRCFLEKACKPTKAEDEAPKKMTLNCSLAITSVAPLLKYAPTQWSHPPARCANSFASMRKSFSSLWPKKPRVSLAPLRNLHACINTMPPAFKFGSLAAMAGAGLMWRNRK